jgi:excisionase family DNA binding protein
MNELTAQQVAERLGVTVRRVQAMVKDGRLPASRFGRAIVIRESDLSLVADRTPGRPPKAKPEDSPATTTNGTATKATAKKAVKRGKS